MAGRVFVTGGSGFVGSAVIDELLRRGYDVNALVHSRPVKAAARAVNSIPGGLFDAAALDRGLAGCTAAIHLVGIIFQHRSKGVTFERMHAQATRNVVEAARRGGVGRYVQMSALGTRLDAVSEYHKTKYEAELIVRCSGLDWTIFRPSVIHGSGGEFMRTAARWARKQAAPFLFMPYFGAGPLGRGGAGTIQPVFVGDVARAFVDALEKPRTIGQTYPLGGQTPLTWPQMQQIIARAVVGKKRLVMGLPAWYARVLTHLVPPALLPFNRDQVIMSQEQGTCDLAKFVGDFGWTPMGFEESLQGYAKDL